MKPVFSFQRGTSPLLVSIPHSGLFVPQLVSDQLTSRARQLPDTDWFVDRLYQWVVAKGGGLLVANYSRYVIDLNRPPDNAALYAGPGTGLLPEQAFDGMPLYQPGMQPDEDEVIQRLQRYWKPYHEQLRMELQVLKQRFGHAILLDAHSIFREVPTLFDGRLPDLNLGSYRGASADSGLVSESMAALGANPEFSLVLDGRFQGGYITRNYGCPHNGIHALQLEMAQSVYMCEQQHPHDEGAYDEDRAGRLLPVLQGLVDVLIKWSPVNL